MTYTDCFKFHRVLPTYSTGRIPPRETNIDSHHSRCRCDSIRSLLICTGPVHREDWQTDNHDLGCGGNDDSVQSNCCGIQYSRPGGCHYDCGHVLSVL